MTEKNIFVYKLFLSLSISDFSSSSLLYIANSVFSKVKSAITSLFDGPEVLSTVSDNAKLFTEIFSKNSNDTCVTSDISRNFGRKLGFLGHLSQPRWVWGKTLVGAQGAKLPETLRI